MKGAAIRETDLYAPVKALLERQGYVVKSEIGAADVVALRDGEGPVIVEMKTGFSLSLFHQAVERLAVADTVYVAVPRRAGMAFNRSLKANTRLCRRLGLGLITVRLADGLTEVHCDPGPYAPRRNARKAATLLREFDKRRGDPNTGGSTRVQIVTAYRQDAVTIASWLGANGPEKAAIIARETEIARARTIMADNHYGWFERVARGVYAVTDAGAEAGRSATDQAETLAIHGRS